MDRKVEGKPTKEVWLVEEIKYDYYEHKSELHVKSLLGLFSNKTAATKNGKEASPTSTNSTFISQAKNCPTKISLDQMER